MPMVLFKKPNLSRFPPVSFRSPHLSWDIFQEQLEQKLSLPPFCEGGYEIGYEVTSPLPRLPTQYFVITNELSFQNAIGVLHNRSSQQDKAGPSVNIYVYSPIPLALASLSSRLHDPKGKGKQKMTIINSNSEAEESSSEAEEGIDIDLPDAPRTSSTPQAADDPELADGTEPESAHEATPLLHPSAG
jgi:hypothetical protein